MALLQKRPIFLRSLLIVATPYQPKWMHITDAFSCMCYTYRYNIKNQNLQPPLAHPLFCVCVFLSLCLLCMSLCVCVSVYVSLCMSLCVCLAMNVCVYVSLPLFESFRSHDVLWVITIYDDFSTLKKKGKKNKKNHIIVEKKLRVWQCVRVSMCMHVACLGCVHKEYT